MKRIVAFLIVISLSVNGLYGRSIQDLRATGGVRSLGYFQKRLNLSGKGISSLEGLGQIRRIQQVSILRLDNNSMTEVEEGALSSLEKNLRVINLSNNLLTGDGLRGLVGMKSLRALILNSNDINDIPQEVLDGLPKLAFISLYDNPISVEKVNQLRHKGYYVSTWPITRSNLKKAGLAALALASLILAAVGLRGWSKIESDRNGQEKQEQKEQPPEQEQKEQPSEEVKKEPVKGYSPLDEAAHRLPKTLQAYFLTENAANEELLREYSQMPEDLSDADRKSLAARVSNRIEYNKKLIEKLSSLKSEKGVLAPPDTAIDTVIDHLESTNDKIRKRFEDFFIL